MLPPRDASALHACRSILAASTVADRFGQEGTVPRFLHSICPAVLVMPQAPARPFAAMVVGGYPPIMEREGSRSSACLISAAPFVPSSSALARCWA